MIWNANQLAGFYMNGILIWNGFDCFDFCTAKWKTSFSAVARQLQLQYFYFFELKAACRYFFKICLFVLSSVLCDHEFFSGKLLMSVVFLHCEILFFYFFSLSLDSAVLYSEIMILLLRTTCCKIVHFIKTTAKRFVKNKTFHMHFREKIWKFWFPLFCFG